MVPPLAIGARLADRFRLDAVVGRGGTATVYRAWDERLGVVRAVKVLDPGALGGREALRRRLHDEARAMARLSHPNVLEIRDVGVDGEHDFVVMDYAEAGSVAARIEREGPLPPIEALSVARQVLGALALAHAAGVVHRDVKAQNLLLGKDGEVMLADFGIALFSADESTRATRTGVAMGSMATMAPEQRLDARNVNATADIYAVGATLYALITAESPIDLFMAGEASPRLSALPAPVREVVVRATRYEPERRYASAAEMDEAVAEAMRKLGAPGVLPRGLPPPAGSVRLPPASTLGERTDAPSTTFGPGASETWVRPDPAPAPAVEGPPGRIQPRLLALWLALGVGVLVALGLWVRGSETVSPAAPTPPEPDVAAALPAPAAAPPSGEAPAPAAPPPAAVEGPTARPTAPAVTAASSPPAASPVEPAAEDAPVADGVRGRWTVSFGGVAGTLRLRGRDDAIEGDVETRRGGRSARFAVKGEYDSGARRLLLTDDDAQDPGVYELQFEPAMDRFAGIVVLQSGRRVVAQGWR